jgi:hypothetical protein
MKLTKEQIDKYIENFIFDDSTFQVDNDGQVVIYLGLYRRGDGSIHDCAETNDVETSAPELN